jgi:exodeoxyribonuclease VII large subunit
MVLYNMASNIPEFSVTELSMALKRNIEDGFSRVRVRGELSKVKLHSSGHLYSDLKDQNCLINIICWRAQVAKLSVKPEEGLEVICTGKITTYPARSNYQMVVETMELAGQGALLKLLEERRQKLLAEGLFDLSRKKPLPFLPKIVGVVTSPTGAVIRDILHRLNDRCPCHVMLWPVKVQGDGAANEIANAIDGFNTLPQHQKPDVLIVGRGGGSTEDLMPFNEEIVVRAIANSTIPIVSAVGHETDTSLSDFAADLRAPTPTAAAEMIMPERVILLQTITSITVRAQKSINDTLKNLKKSIDHSNALMGDPISLINTKIQTLDYLSDQLKLTSQNKIQKLDLRFSQIMLPKPFDTIKLLDQSLNLSVHKLKSMTENLLEKTEQNIVNLTRMLEVLSYKSVLDRGFAFLRDQSGNAITSTKQLKNNDIIDIHLNDGETKAKII